MTIVSERERLDDEFTSRGRRYRWVEGEPAEDPRAERLRGRRDALREVFERTVLPGLERRGAARSLRTATAGVSGLRGQWVSWLAPGDLHPVWALYVPTKCLGRGIAANDGWVLAAWGDGPVMAWASERFELREALREALRSPPLFLTEGVVSGDASFPLRVTTV